MNRLISIDALRGLIILIMLLDHVRDVFYLQNQVADPMNLDETSAFMFFSRMLAHLCAPIFVFLTGLSAYLYGQKCKNINEISEFLLKRGLFLVVLEITIVGFAWVPEFPPSKFYLQVIWAIGISMISLAILIRLPRIYLLIIGIVFVAGHNLLDNLHFAKDSFMYIPWAILHDRGWLDFGIFKARTSYPVLPWIGIIALGYFIGSWFTKNFDKIKRQKKLFKWSAIGFLTFLIFRGFNIYGQSQGWSIQEDSFKTFMSFFNIQKYPPSFLFSLFTLSCGLLILALLEKKQNIENCKITKILCVFGSAPMFFYVLHLYVLRVLYVLALNILGPNYLNVDFFGDVYALHNVGQLWLMAIILGVILYFPVKIFSDFKKKRKDLSWLKYF